MWIVDLFLMPSFIQYSNDKLGFNKNINNDTSNNNNNNKDNNNLNNNNDNKVNIQLENVEINGEKENEKKDNKNENENEKENKNKENENEITSTRLDTVNIGSNDKNIEIKENNEIKEIQKKEEIEYQRALYTAYLYWTPLMGCIGVYYIYLGQYKQFALRLFTFNLLMIGWLADAYRMPTLVKNKLKNENLNDANNQNENLIN